MEYEDANFFDVAFTTIYEKLTNEERTEFNSELAEDGITSKESTPKYRFLSLLRFIEVKYVMMTKWIKGISNTLAIIGDSPKTKSALVDIVFVDETETKASFSEFKQQEPKFNELADSFTQLLEQLGLTTEYQKYLKSSGFVREEEY